MKVDPFFLPLVKDGEKSIFSKCYLLGVFSEFIFFSRNWSHQFSTSGTYLKNPPKLAQHCPDDLYIGQPTFTNVVFLCHKLVKAVF